MGQARDTADPLGFRAAAVRVARRLVPALTQSSFRARGFSLVCFGLDAGRRPPTLLDRAIDDAFLRFARLVVYAQCHHHPDGRLPDDVRYSGTQRAYAQLRSSSKLDLNLPLLLHDDLTGGLWGAYRHPAVHLGLLSPRWNRSNPAATNLSQLGAELVRSIEGSAVVIPTGTRKLVRDRALSTTQERAAELIAPDTGAATRQEADVLSRTLAAYDSKRAKQGKGQPFAALRTAFDVDGGKLTLDRLNRSALTEGQKLALDDAWALTALMKAVEKPYRQWVTGGRAVLSKTVAQHPAWALVRLMGEPDLRRLLMDLDIHPTLDAVHRHQQRLATDRGREPWERDEPRLGREEMFIPDFTLGAAAQLFADGVNPHRKQGV
jgi:hypothetical protein